LIDHVFTLASTLLGALIGLAAPLIATSRGDQDKRRERQREVAAAIMDLFEEAGPRFEEFTSPTSRPRMKLYLMALRLDGEAPRQACLAFVAGAGRADTGHAGLTELWDTMMVQVGSVYRLGRAERGR
jgi:hypothetical protein